MWRSRAWERLDGLYLGGINDRAFLVLARRGDARFDPAPPIRRRSELLGADGPAAFAPHTNTPAESDEFEQAELF